MEPNLSYTPRYGLGQKFVDAKARKFEIIETHWGIPGDQLKGLPVTLELTTGHKIHQYGSPSQTVLQKVAFRQVDAPDAKLVETTVDELQQAEDSRRIKFI